MSTPSLLVAAIAACANAPVPYAIEAGVPVLEQLAPPVVAWEELAHDPEAFLGQEVRLFLQHHSERETWNPYMTRFADHTFRALNGWSDAQRLWVQEDFDAPVARVFVRRGSEADRVLHGVARHRRSMLTVVVREVFVGRPWIEVTHAHVMKSHVPEGTILHAIRAFELVEKKALLRAKDEFTRALAAPLPVAVARDLEAALARCEPPQRKVRTAAVRRRARDQPARK
ncbi:MAG: hypothetical protein GY711_00470 [bacterium]|nr:hypothetical protein [bacterium]